MRGQTRTGDVRWGGGSLSCCRSLVLTGGNLQSRGRNKDAPGPRHSSMGWQNGARWFRRRLRNFSGGAGIRTPVRDKIDHSVYVRVPLIEVSSRWPMDSPLLDKSSKFSPTTGRRGSRLSRIFDTHKAASGGLLYEQVQQLLRVTQPGPSCCWQLKNIPEVLPGPEYLGTRPQLH